MNRGLLSTPSSTLCRLYCILSMQTLLWSWLYLVDWNNKNYFIWFFSGIKTRWIFLIILSNFSADNNCDWNCNIGLTKPQSDIFFKITLPLVKTNNLTYSIFCSVSLITAAQKWFNLQPRRRRKEGGATCRKIKSEKRDNTPPTHAAWLTADL